MQTVTDVLLALFLALGSAWFAVDLVRKLRQTSADCAAPRREVIASPAAPAPAPPAPPAPVVAAAIPASQETKASPRSEAGDVPADHLVAITAAVHHVFKGRARLLSAVAAGAATSAGNAAPAAQVDWAREGRRDIFTSHRVR